MNVNVYQLLEKNSKLYGNKVAFFDDNNQISYSDLFFEVVSLHNFFETLGITMDVIVRLDVTKNISSFIIFLTLLCDNISVLPAKKSEELDFPYTCIIGLVPHNQQSVAFSCFGETRYISFLTTSIDSQLAMINHGLYINSTSGSSGSKKFCFSNWDKIIVNTKSVCDVYCVSKEDVLISLFPAHIHIHESFMRGLFSGGTNLLIDNTDITSIANNIFLRKVSQIQGTPNQLLALTEKLQPSMCKSVKVVECCGGSLSVKAENILKTIFSEATIVRAWGSAETTGVCISTIISADNNPKSIGKCLPLYEYKLKQNECIGHYNLLLKGEAVMSYIYVGTELRKIGDWLDTGDLVECGNNGNLYFYGRNNGMIKYAGENIYPEEIENTLCRVQGIIDAIVVGVYDDLLGEYPAALIQKEKEVELSNNMIKKALLEMQLAINKIPKKISITDMSLPYKESGKKDRTLVKAYFD